MGDVPKRRGPGKRTAPPAVYTDTFRFLLTPEMKEYILRNGGAEFIRDLVAREQAATGTREQTMHRETMQARSYADNPLTGTAAEQEKRPEMMTVAELPANPLVGMAVDQERGPEVMTVAQVAVASELRDAIRKAQDVLRDMGTAYPGNADLLTADDRTNQIADAIGAVAKNRKKRES